ncbi:unnamed protein product [Rotaria sp. Silwood1]|nr:unnamed protein product [Rotaria sp. Silwood1]CAF1625463.1 unnamed protein product [Rotaria sp. Silwood1]CAF3731460.1 unnamed protein product [Rotaria sp. Silwood1]CAF3770036.1 unnamed protein product [Rotaria sp. Silwood1]CAF4671225.1 unnamed protein product [Rotaria sp. Silwood1]
MGICNEKPTHLDIDHYKSLLSIEEFKQIPIVSLEQAIEPLGSLIPTIKTYVQMIKEKCRNPADGLTSDESASIMLYSIIWQPIDECLYTVLNSLLQTLDKNKLQPWILYLKLLFSALIHLPSNQLIVYRDNKSNLSKQYHIDEIIVWQDLPLCTSSIEYLQSEKYLDKTEIRTLFTIECNTVKNINKHCYFQADNYLLFLPFTKFQIIKCSYQHNENLHFITLKEIESSFLLNSLNEIKTNLNTSISLNIFQRFCLSFKIFGNQSSISNDHYHNTSLEHRILKNEHSWAIDLDRQNLTDRDMKIIVKYAIIKNHCKRIRLRDNNFTSYCTTILSEGLYNNTTLKSLDLRNNHLSDLGVQILALSIIHSNVETLNLESNDITSEGAQYLAQILRNSRTLTELYLSKNFLGDRGVKYLANALSEDTINIQEQSNNSISVANQTILQHLYLGQNDITDEGIKYLCDMLKTNQTLSWLWLTDNKISNQGVKFLSNILVDYNMTLEWLFLESNKLINDLCIDDLIYMIKRNNTLKTLYINNCSLTDITKRKLIKITKTKRDFDLEV